MFGGNQQAQSGVSDLLLGARGFSSSLGNGFSNDTNASTSATAGGTSSGSNAFDLNDFPSLGGNAGNSVGSANSNSSNGLAAALRQQQQLLAHQQMLQGSGKQQQQQQQQQQQNNLYRLAMSGGSNGGNFNMATEDFPALPGAPPGSSANSGNSVSSPSPSSMLMGGSGGVINAGPGGAAFGSSRSASGSSSLYSNDSIDAPGSSKLEGAGLLGGSSLGGAGGLNVLSGLQHSSSNPSSMQSSRPAAATVSSTASSGGGGPAAGTALSGDYGLLGLLGVIRMTDDDRNALALGSDLTMLGMNLGSADQIYQTFASPFASGGSQTKEPHFQLPSCYFMQPPALKTGHLSKFQPETLFYIFYAFPKDVLQAYAAQELYSRDWRYHGELKLWFKRTVPSDGSSAQYLYFDLNSWERRGFTGNVTQSLTGGFLSEDDVRVKFPNS